MKKAPKSLFAIIIMLVFALVLFPEMKEELSVIKTYAAENDVNDGFDKTTTVKSDDVADSFDEDVKDGFDETTTQAEPQELSGKCGPNLTWVLSADGVLTIEGTGDMYNFYSNEEDKIDYDKKEDADFDNAYDGFDETETAVDADSTQKNYKNYIILGSNNKTTVRSTTRAWVTTTRKPVTTTKKAYTTSEATTTTSTAETITEVITTTARSTTTTETLSCSDLPWGNQSKKIKSIVIGEGATSIGCRAFRNCTSLISVSMPSTITKIGKEAFENCSALTEINIPDNVEEIEEYSFFRCSSLIKIDLSKNLKCIGYRAFEKTAPTEIAIPENVKVINGYAFANCSNLETLFFNAQNCKSISYHAFNGCSVNTLYVGANVNYLPDINTYETVVFADGATKVPNSSFNYCSELTSVTMPDTITKIGNDAFFGCFCLDEINLPQNLAIIGNYAFSDCFSLNNVELPKNLEIIGQNAFYRTSLTEITIPENVKGIGSHAFANCANLKSVTFNAINCESSGDSFYNSNNITSVTIGSKVTLIPNWFMHNKQGITSVEIPSSVKGIGGYAFDSTSISSIEIPNGVEIIGKNAFANLEKTKNLTIPESVKTIGTTAFVNMIALTEINFNAINAELAYPYYSDTFANAGTADEGITVTFGEKVETIPMYLFEVGSETAYPNIVKVLIGSNVITIGEKAFYRCCSLRVVDFNNNIETIEDFAFSGCFNVEKADLPQSLKNIGEDAFSDCYGISTITIPEKVEHIGTDAFYRCINLTEVNYNATDCEINNNNLSSVFNGCTGIEKVYIGERVERLYAYSFTGCENLRYIYIPDIAIYIDPLAFYGCSYASVVCDSGSYANVFAIQNGVKYILNDNVNCTAFEIKNGMLLSYSGTAKNIVIPSEISYIGIDAFKENTTVESIEIPYSVTKIFANAFSGSVNLRQVIIPFTVTEISNNAFSETTARILCYYNSFAHKYAVTNNIDYELINVTLSTESINIVEGETVEVNAVPSVVLASGLPMVWESDNTSVASVNSKGNIVGISSGNTSVGVYSINGNLLGKCFVQVTEPTKVNFEETSTDTLKYGEKLILHINTANLPAGSSIKWTTTDGNILKLSNENAICSTHENCVTCTIESVGNGSAEIKAAVVDENGNPIVEKGKEISTSYKMTSKAGFFDKIIAFFKKLFGLTKTIPQIYKGIF